jgi:hypothetical protein
LWELHELHVPLDDLTRTGAYEQRALTRLTEGTCVAVVRPSGAGKSSVIAWVCYPLPSSHFALRIPITGVRDPGSVGEVPRLALSITLDEVVLDATAQEELEKSRATSQSSTRTPSGIATAGREVGPAEVNVNVASLRDEFTQERLGGDHLLALNGRLVPILAEAGTTPSFVFEDTGGHSRGRRRSRRAESVFAGPLSAFVDQVGARTIVAVGTHLIEGSRAFTRLAPVLERIAIPLLSEPARNASESIRVRRIELAQLPAWRAQQEAAGSPGSESVPVTEA